MRLDLRLLELHYYFTMPSQFLLNGMETIIDEFLARGLLFNANERCVEHDNEMHIQTDYF